MWCRISLAWREGAGRGTAGGEGVGVGQGGGGQTWGGGGRTEHLWRSLLAAAAAAVTAFSCRRCHDRRCCSYLLCVRLSAANRLLQPCRPPTRLPSLVTPPRPSPAHLDLNVRCLALGATQGLMDHDAAVGQAVALALVAGRQQEGAHGGGQAHAHGGHVGADVAHGVKHSHACVASRGGGGVRVSGRPWQQGHGPSARGRLCLAA